MKGEDLRVGDYYVNARYGVCKYNGTEMFSDGEYYIFNYKNKRQRCMTEQQVRQMLYFYMSKEEGDEKQVKLDNADNTKSWKKRKERSLCEIKETAKKLVDLSIERKSLEGKKYNIDGILEEFSNLLPFEMSEGQISAITDINNDLNNSKVVNRLIYGGCGAGKTTVLQYCCFLAYKNHFQSIVLCPSTILAEQHYNGMKELFKDYDINIELLVSKTTPKNKQKIYEGAADGSINIFIGTTSLRKDIKYSNLNLFLTDEPQKFGVKAKTYIKELQSNINTIQATGTPLPRDFLEIEAGVMDISKIMTYPKGKKPIITKTINDTNDNIKDIIQFELQRNGQIYFVYNNVNEQYGMREKLLEIIPELKICIINGKMNKKESSQVIEDFTNKKYNLMIATSIIETGVNIDVNTMIIYEPDKWGMSSLHQVRNRVGRFGKQGYCYLVKSKGTTNNEIAAKRLQTICKYNQLGQDILIAEQDRKNRGDGELFGTCQSGHKFQIGYTMYKELLSKEIQEQKQNII